MRRAVRLGAILVASTVLAGCAAFGGGCSIAQGSFSDGQGQEGACNETNSFAYGYQGQGEGVSETFTWENTEGQADVNWGAQGQGSVSVTIQDADGTVVFSDTFQGQGQGGTSESTDPGATGDWTIEIESSGFQGQFGVGVQAT